MSRRDAATEGLVRLLGAQPPADYLGAWSRALARSAFARLEDRNEASLVVRVGTSWLALSLPALQAVHPFGPVRSVPGRSNAVFRGLVNLRGELHLCGDLHTLLHVEAPRRAPGESRSPSARLVRLAADGRSWAFEVDAIRGVERHGPKAERTPQSTVDRARVHYTRGLLELSSLRVARLDASRVVAAFEEALA